MDLETIADKLAEELPNHKHIIIGDLNAHVLGCHSNETNENGELLLRLCQNTNMTIVPLPGPTFIRGETKTTVDYILMDPGSRAELHQADVLDTHYIHSDHQITEATLERNQPLPQ